MKHGKQIYGGTSWVGLVEWEAAAQVVFCSHNPFDHKSSLVKGNEPVRCPIIPRFHSGSMVFLDSQHADLGSPRWWKFPMLLGFLGLLHFSVVSLVFSLLAPFLRRSTCQRKWEDTRPYGLKGKKTTGGGFLVCFLWLWPLQPFLISFWILFQRFICSWVCGRSHSVAWPAMALDDFPGDALQIVAWSLHAPKVVSFCERNLISPPEDHYIMESGSHKKTQQKTTKPVVWILSQSRRSQGLFPDIWSFLQTGRWEAKCSAKGLFDLRRALSFLNLKVREPSFSLRKFLPLLLDSFGIFGDFKNLRMLIDAFLSHAGTAHAGGRGWVCDFCAQAHADIT